MCPRPVPVGRAAAPLPRFRQCAPIHSPTLPPTSVNTPTLACRRSRLLHSSPINRHRLAFKMFSHQQGDPTMLHTNARPPKDISTQAVDTLICITFLHIISRRLVLHSCTYTSRIVARHGFNDNLGASVSSSARAPVLSSHRTRRHFTTSSILHSPSHLPSIIYIPHSSLSI